MKLFQYKAEPMYTADSDSEQLKVLIIDENKEFANLLQALFKDLNYKAYTTYNEKNGTAKLQKIVPDLIVCDTGLSDGGSDRIATKIKMDLSLNHIFFVALTSDRHHSIHHGTKYDYYLSKPLETTVLNDILDEVEYRKQDLTRLRPVAGL